MTDRSVLPRRRASVPRRPRRLAAAALLAVLLGAAGCGGDDPPGAAGGPDTPPASPGGAPAEEPAGAVPDACTLLTPAEIESATGVAYGDGELQEVMSFGDQTACNYTPSDGGAAFVLVLVNGTGGSFDAQRETADEALGTPSEEVAGIGDDAFWIDETDTLATHVGDTYLQVTYAGGDRETATGLVQTALAKL